MARKPSPASFGAAAPLFAALGDPQRLTLVSRLCQEGPLSIARLSEGADITRQAVSKHLYVLAEAGVIRGTREGRENVFEIEPRRLKEARGHLDRISSQWDAALARLRALVEK